MILLLDGRSVAGTFLLVEINLQNKSAVGLLPCPWTAAAADLGLRPRATARAPPPGLGGCTWRWPASGWAAWSRVGRRRRAGPLAARGMLRLAPAR